MKFPAYVPHAVRIYIQHQLEGDADKTEQASNPSDAQFADAPRWPGYRTLVEDANSYLQRIESEIEFRTQPQTCSCCGVVFIPEYGDEDYGLNSNDDEFFGTSLLDLRDHLRVMAKEKRDRLAADFDRLKRLGGLISDDQRIREAYQALAGEFSDDDQWRKFISSACLAIADYSGYRERLRQAEALRIKIASMARELALLIRKLRYTGVMLPDEFLKGAFKEGITLGSNPKEAMLLIPLMLRAGKFENEPDVVDLLWKINGAAATSFVDPFSAHIDAAIGSQKPNVKTEYIRALASLLAQGEDAITMTAVVRAAMAVTATVVLDDPDIEVSADDVRKALGRDCRKPLEHSDRSRRENVPAGQTIRAKKQR
jgi:hypothetical protein